MHIKICGQEVQVPKTARTTQSFFEKAEESGTSGASRYQTLSLLFMGGASSLYDTCAYSVNAVADMVLLWPTSRKEDKILQHCRQQVTNAFHSLMCCITSIFLCVVAIINPRNAVQKIINNSVVDAYPISVVFGSDNMRLLYIPKGATLANIYFIRAREIGGHSRYQLAVNLFLGCSALLLHTPIYIVSAIVESIIIAPYDATAAHHNFKTQCINALCSIYCVAVGTIMAFNAWVNPTYIARCITVIRAPNHGGGDNGNQWESDTEKAMVLSALGRFDLKDRKEIWDYVQKECQSLGIQNGCNLNELSPSSCDNCPTIKLLLAKLMVYTDSEDQNFDQIKPYIQQELDSARHAYDQGGIRDRMAAAREQNKRNEQRSSQTISKQKLEYTLSQEEEARKKQLEEGEKLCQQCSLHSEAYEAAVKELGTKLKSGLYVIATKGELEHTIEQITRQRLAMLTEMGTKLISAIAKFEGSSEPLFQTTQKVVAAMIKDGCSVTSYEKDKKQYDLLIARLKKHTRLEAQTQWNQLVKDAHGDKDWETLRSILLQRLESA